MIPRTDQVRQHTLGSPISVFPGEPYRAAALGTLPIDSRLVEVRDALRLRGSTHETIRNKFQSGRSDRLWRTIMTSSEPIIFSHLECQFKEDAQWSETLSRQEKAGFVMKLFVPKAIAPLGALLVLSWIGSSCQGDSFLGTKPERAKLSESANPNEKPSRTIPRVEQADGTAASGFEVSEEASIATDITGTYLSIPTGIKAAGKATKLQTASLAPDSEFGALRLVLPRESVEDDSKLVVLYHVTRENGKNYVGLIPKSQLELARDSVRVQPRAQGVYQTAILPVFLGDPRETEVPQAPAGPKLVKHSSYNSQGTARDLVLVNGTTAYLADTNGLEALNWSPTLGLKLSYRVEAAGNASVQAVLSMPSKIYVAAGPAGLGLLDLERTNKSLSFWPTRGITNGLASAPNPDTVYTSQEAVPNDSQTSAGLSRVNIGESTPAYETTESVVEGNTGTPYYSLQIRNSTAYTIGRRALHVYDITNNDRIVGLDLLSLDSQADRLVLQDDRAYVVDKQSGIIVVDVTVSTDLRRVSTMSLPNLVDLAVMGRYLIAADSMGSVSLIETSDPTRLTVLNTFKVQGVPTRVRVFGDFIFVTTGADGVEVLKIQ